MPFYNFVCTFVEILTEYSKSGNANDYNDDVVFNLNSYLVDFYVPYWSNFISLENIKPIRQKSIGNFSVF